MLLRNALERGGLSPNEAQGLRSSLIFAEQQVWCSDITMAVVLALSDMQLRAIEFLLPAFCFLQYMERPKQSVTCVCNDP